MKKVFLTVSVILLLNQQCLPANIHGVFTIDPSRMHLIKKAWSVSTGGSHGSYYSMVINNQFFSGERPWGLRWDMIKDVIDYKNKRVLELGCSMGLVTTFLKKYRGVKKAVGVDGPQWLLSHQGDPHKVEAARWVAQAFEVDVRFMQVYIDNDPHDVQSRYEDKIGYDHDIVFCMSLLNWVKDKERLLRYLSNFNDVIFEGHDSNEREIERFARYGFNYRILGVADKRRTLIHFFK